MLTKWFESEVALLLGTRDEQVHQLGLIDTLLDRLDKLEFFFEYVQVHDCKESQGFEVQTFFRLRFNHLEHP